MQTLVIYDISDDKCRNRIIEVCKDYGLERIQYSCFLGDLNENKRQEMALRLRTEIMKEDGDIQIIPVCDKDLKRRKILCVTKPKQNENSECA